MVQNAKSAVSRLPGSISRKNIPGLPNRFSSISQVSPPYPSLSIPYSLTMAVLHQYDYIFTMGMLFAFLGRLEHREQTMSPTPSQRPSPLAP